MKFILITFIIVILSFVSLTFAQSSSSSSVEACPSSPYVNTPPSKVYYPNELSSADKLFHEKYMRIALNKAIEHNSKFGAAIVHKNGTLMCTSANLGTVSRILHAEIRAIMNCSELYGLTTLEDHYLYTTGEPCPMCAASLMWSKFDKVIFGSYVSNMYCERCFNQLPMNANEIFKLGYGINHNIVAVGGILESETDLLFTSLCGTTGGWSVVPVCNAGWNRTCPRDIFKSESSEDN